MKPSIVPVTFALLQPQLVASKGIKVGARKTSGKQIEQIVAEPQPSEEEQTKRDLYTSETIDLEQGECCNTTYTSVTEVNYVYNDDYGTIDPSPPPTDISTPAPTEMEISTPAPTPNPQSDDDGFSYDFFIPTPDPTPSPSGKPLSVGYLPTSSYQPTYDDIDDWAPGWMPTNPSMNDDDENRDGDVDDWKGGYPVVTRPTVDSKAGKGSKAGSKSGKGGKGSKSSLMDDDQYRAYGLSKVSSLISSELASSAVTVDNFGVASFAAVVSGAFFYLYA